MIILILKATVNPGEYIWNSSKLKQTSFWKNSLEHLKKNVEKGGREMIFY